MFGQPTHGNLATVIKSSKDSGIPGPDLDFRPFRGRGRQAGQRLGTQTIVGVQEKDEISSRRFNCAYGRIGGSSPGAIYHANIGIALPEIIDKGTVAVVNDNMLDPDRAVLIDTANCSVNVLRRVQS